jgi:membrane protein
LHPQNQEVASLLGLGTLLFAAIGAVVQLKDALNTVWEVGEIPGHGIWHFMRSYIVSLAAVLALGFLLLVSLIVTAELAAFGKYAAPHIQEWLLHLISILVSLSVISLLFAMMFKWLPDAAVDWYDVWLGAIITAVLFELGKSAIEFYIGKQGLDSTYGAAASIIVVLIWVYYTSQIILMGAEVTHAFAKHRGSIKKREGKSRSQAVSNRLQ